MGAFKFRGAFNALSCFDAAQRTARRRRLLVGQPRAGHRARRPACSPCRPRSSCRTTRPRRRSRRRRDYGGHVVFYDRYTEDREAIGRRLADEHGLTLIPPYDHPHVIAGQGTAAKELFDDVGPLDALFVCLGGGGLLAGSALATRALSPATQALRRGARSRQRRPAVVPLRRASSTSTRRTRSPTARRRSTSAHHTFEIIRRDVDDVLTVSDAELVDGMRFFASRMKMIVEPTGCLGFAAARKGTTCRDSGSA